MKTFKKQRDLDRIAQQLAADDPLLRRIYNRLGAPPLWNRSPGLATLLRIVLEQQVSLASGKAAWNKLVEACGGRVSAARIVELGEQPLRSTARLTRQKAAYVYGISLANRRRQLNFRALESLPDDEAFHQLTSIRGIGPWTANIYLMMGLGRADILPLGDLALEIELGRLCQLGERPDRDWIVRRARRWQPYRAAATRMLWHHYLDRLGRHHEI